MTGNRIHFVMPSLDITYTAGLSFVGNVISNGWTMNGMLNASPEPWCLTPIPATHPLEEEKDMQLTPA